MSLNAISAEQLKRSNEHYANTFPNWTMSLYKWPIFSYRQMEYEEDYIGTGYMSSRRPGVKETGKALAELLTYEAVENLIAENKITPTLAREWGAMIQYAKKKVPFNLIAYGLEGATEDPEEPPTPKTDRLVMLGLLFPTEEAVAHFKLWYEDGRADLNFEQDLIMPLLTYWRLYRAEYGHVRGIEFGTGSVSKGTAASLEVSFVRKNDEPDAGSHGDYPDLDINVVKSDSDMEEEDDEDDEDTPKPVGLSPSGAQIFG